MCLERSLWEIDLEEIKPSRNWSSREAVVVRCFIRDRPYPVSSREKEHTPFRTSELTPTPPRHSSSIQFNSSSICVYLFKVMKHGGQRTMYTYCAKLKVEQYRLIPVLEEASELERLPN